MDALVVIEDIIGIIIHGGLSLRIRGAGAAGGKLKA